MDALKAVQILADEFEVERNEYTIELLMELLETYGSVTMVIKEGLKPEYKFLKKLSKIIALQKDDSDKEYEYKTNRLINYIHELNAAIGNEAVIGKKSYQELLNLLKLKETMQLAMKQDTNEMYWVIVRVGGKALVKNINVQEINPLREKIKAVFEQYNHLSKDKKNELALSAGPKIAELLNNNPFWGN